MPYFLGKVEGVSRGIAVTKNLDWGFDRKIGSEVCNVDRSGFQKKSGRSYLKGNY